MASYEEERRRRVEENKKRLLELGILDASREISKQTVKPSKSLAKKIATVEDSGVALRRSARSSSRPNYCEDKAIPLPRKSSGRSSRIVPLKYCSQKARVAAVEAAEDVQRNLTSGFPSAIKTMLQSHVSGGFWLGLPLSFCKQHMPQKDTMFILEDNEEQEHQSLYLAYKNGLSGGWRGFSIDHGLQDGDALVFELTESARLKVHIIRVADYEGNDSEPKPKLTKSKRKQVANSSLIPQLEPQHKVHAEKKPEIVVLEDDDESEEGKETMKSDLKRTRQCSDQALPVASRTRNSTKYVLRRSKRTQTVAAAAG